MKLPLFIEINPSVGKISPRILVPVGKWKLMAVVGAVIELYGPLGVLGSEFETTVPTEVYAKIADCVCSSPFSVYISNDD